MPLPIPAINMVLLQGGQFRYPCYKHDPPPEGRIGLAQFRGQTNDLSDIGAFRDGNIIESR